MPDLAPSPPQSALQWLRSIGNAVNLTTPLGLLIAKIGRARIRPGPRGLVLCEGYRLAFPVASAFTVGNVIITPARWEGLLADQPGLLRHEEGHTWQYLYCLGLPFLIAYPVCLAWSVLRTGDRAAANVFEVQAGLDLGGYAWRPRRPLRVGVRELAGRLRSTVLGPSRV